MFEARRQRKKRLPDDPIPEHWIYYAQSKYERQVLSDIKDVMGVLVLFLPISFFWMVYDQQGSRWTSQALVSFRLCARHNYKPIG